MDSFCAECVVMNTPYISVEFLDQVRAELQDARKRDASQASCEASAGPGNDTPSSAIKTTSENSVVPSSSPTAHGGTDTSIQPTTYTWSRTNSAVTSSTIASQMTAASLTGQATTTPLTSEVAGASTTSTTADTLPISSLRPAHGAAAEVAAMILGIAIGLGLVALVVHKLSRKRVANTQGGSGCNITPYTERDWRESFA